MIIFLEEWDVGYMSQGSSLIAIVLSRESVPGVEGRREATAIQNNVDSI